MPTNKTEQATGAAPGHVASADGLGAKRYPLCVENVGEDTYILMSKGHHDVHEFMRAVRADYSWPLGMPTHEWMRAIPAPKDSGYRCLYVEAKPYSRGAFPATYAREAYGEDRYEAQAPNRCSTTSRISPTNPRRAK